MIENKSSIPGVKLTKEKRRELKFALKRGEKLTIKDIIEERDDGHVKVGTKGKFAQEDFVKPDFTFTILKNKQE